MAEKPRRGERALEFLILMHLKIMKKGGENGIQCSQKTFSGKGKS